MTTAQPLSAPIELSFDYTRSTGPTLGGFLTGLAQRTVRGVRAADGRVIVPPLEYDPATHEPLTDFVDVSDHGEVASWSWAAEPLPGQPLERPFAWALVKLDGADTSLLHALDVPSPDAVHTGMRVQARWADEPVGHIKDIVCFEPETSDAPSREPIADVEDVTMVTTPIAMKVLHTASIQETGYLKGLKEGRLIGQRCPQCRKVYIPPRSACPSDGTPTADAAVMIAEIR